MINVDVLEFWPKILKLQDENLQWRPVLLIIKICLCTPISSASLERLFNQMNLAKPTVLDRLKNSALNALLRIKVSNVSAKTFHKEHVLSCVYFWCNKKGRRLSQGNERGTKRGKQKFLKVQRSASQQYLFCYLLLKALTIGEEHANGLVCNS